MVVLSTHARSTATSMDLEGTLPFFDGEGQNLFPFLLGHERERVSLVAGLKLLKVFLNSRNYCGVVCDFQRVLRKEKGQLKCNGRCELLNSSIAKALRFARRRVHESLRVDSLVSVRVAFF